jgi:hypothetical protein
MRFTSKTERLILPALMLLTLVSAAFVCAPAANGAVVVEMRGDLGIIRGVVRDDGGTPISDATVAIFRAGTSRLLKQVSSGADGSFIAKILPGTYTVLAVAQGFNPMTLFGVEVSRSADLTYGFKLERSGSGNTLPERRTDRNSSKWRIRAAQAQRSIYQNHEGDDPLAAKPTVEEELAANEPAETKTTKKSQSVIETYFADSDQGSYAGVNFATFMPVNEKTDLSLIAQTGKGRIAPQRLGLGLKYRPNSNHQIRLDSSAGRLGNLTINDRTKSLGQTAVRATDEWKVREGVILVLGFDYSRFLGAGRDWNLSPRLGFQYDINSKTRFQAAVSPQTEEKTWADAIDVEGESVAFTEPVAVDDLVVVNNKPQMNKSRRIEFGIERILDSHSSIEANAFADTTLGRGVGLETVSLSPLGNGFGEFVADQQGNTEGIRIVYTRRLNSLFTTSAGYSFGKGQKLSNAGFTDPSRVFESDFFQSFFGQIDADLKTGTSVKTIFRLSPQATVFAIDPFKGRLAIYDPGLSILVTQNLPTLGLPLRAQAVLDARNVLDFQTGIWGDEGSLRLSSQGLSVRGGIQVRF